ncbi:MAG TPA: M20/M25/M40 family metallo-hydrolase [Blastocatellia bacterium]|nr:M20/M25/M40 family metallo-hydrolase [Blastocatellia bacterium]
MNALKNGLLISILTPLVLLQSGASSPQRRREPSDYTYSAALTGDLQKLRDAALSSDYAYSRLAHLCNNIGPRLSGSPQASRAVEYVAAEMRKLGADVTLEKVRVSHWERGIETGEIVEFPGQAPGTVQKIVLTALGGSIATPEEGLTAGVVVVRDFNELNSIGRERVAGKIVLFNAKFDKEKAAQGMALEAYSEAVVYRGAGASAAAKLGAVAALIRSVGGAEFRLPHTGALRYQDGTQRIPAAAVSTEDADLLASLSSQGPIRMRLTLTPKFLDDVESYNVVADLKGSEHPEQVVIVSGHLDSWDLGTGAIDDGAGVVVAMQTLNLIKQLGLRPRRTIRFIAWMNEENGLAGGRAYAEDHRSELSNHVVAIESDLGAGHPAGISFHASEKAIQQLQPIGGVLQSLGANIVRRTLNAEGADVSPLDAAGVPTAAPIQDNRTYFNYHHTAADTLDKVNPRELSENAAVMAVTAYAVACMPEPLQR